MAATILTFPSNPTVLSAHDDGGAPLTSPLVNLIFWGKAWSAEPPPSPTAHTITSAIRSIVNSNFLGELNQYGVVGQPQVIATDVASETDPVARRLRFAGIASRIEAGKVPAPVADRRSFYGVIVPPGVKSTEHPNDAGAHTTFTHGGFTSAMAWIQNDGQLTTRFSAVHIFSHEFAEACASGNNVGLDTAEKNNQEICDVCTDDDDTSNGYSLHGYYSQKDKLCVIPLTRPIFVPAGPAAAVSRNGDDIDLAAIGSGPGGL